MAAVLERMESQTRTQVKRMPTRAEVWSANLPEVQGSIQKGVRPVLVISNNRGNKYSTTVIVIPFSTNINKNMPTHVLLDPDSTGLMRPSVAMAEQILTVEKSCLMNYITKLDENNMDRINQGIAVSVLQY